MTDATPQVQRLLMLAFDYRTAITQEEAEVAFGALESALTAALASRQAVPEEVAQAVPDSERAGIAKLIADLSEFAHSDRAGDMCVRLLYAADLLERLASRQAPVPAIYTSREQLDDAIAGKAEAIVVSTVAEGVTDYGDSAVALYELKNASPVPFDALAVPLYTAAPAGLPDGWVAVPKEPTPEMLRCIRNREWPADWEAGKRLQREQMSRKLPLDQCVPFECNMEIAVGQYQRMLAAADTPAAPKGEPR